MKSTESFPACVYGFFPFLLNYVRSPGQNDKHQEITKFKQKASPYGDAQFLLALTLQ